MKILFISFDFPFPPTGGSISRDYNLIKQLSKHHELFWINRTTRGKVKDNYISEMQKYFKLMKIVEWDYRQNYAELVKSLFTNEPYIIRRFRSSEMKNTVEKMINDNEFDLILCDHIYLAQYLPETIVGKMPVIPNNEDCGFTFYKRMSENSGFIRKLYARSQWEKILKYEIAVLEKFKSYITTSENEKELISSYYDKARIFVIENGVDTGYFKFREHQPSGANLIFTAWFGYYPNVEAVNYFVRDIFPLIRKVLPDATFTIAGKEPPQSVIDLGKMDGIKVTGYVEDIRTLLRDANVAVIPLKSGGGTRLKILEAMSSGIPVVSTPIGAEGLRYSEGENILIGKSDRDFAEKTVRVIRDSSLAEGLSLKARLLVEEEYDWEIIGDKLSLCLETYVSEFKQFEHA